MTDLIINDDCLSYMKTMDDNSIDMLLTDPPYGISFQSNHRKVKYNKIENDNNLLWLPEFINELYRICRDNTAHYMFCSHHNIDVFKQAIEHKFDVKDILVWVKNNTGMGDLKGSFAPKVEFILFFKKGKRNINGRRDPNIFTFSKTNNINHPTEKPIDLCEYLISKFSNESDVIFDPFASSGSTGIAAKNTKRNYILIEKDVTYYNNSLNRIQNENKQT